MIERKPGHITLILVALIFFGAAVLTLMPLKSVWKVEK